MAIRVIFTSIKRDASSTQKIIQSLTVHAKKNLSANAASYDKSNS